MNPGRGCVALTTGTPAVSVPVLSTTSVSIFSARSSDAALRTRMPADAPLPTPTISAVGVARPSAHGHAITSTAVARISASPQSPSARPLPTSVTAAMTSTAGTNHADTASARRCTGAFDPCAAAT